MSFWIPQSEALNAIKQTYQEHPEGSIPQPQIVQIPTGCGKSTVISMLPRYVFSAAHRADHKVVVLVIVPNVALVRQTVQAIQKSYERYRDENETIVCIELSSRMHLLRVLEDHQTTIHMPFTFHFLVINIQKLINSFTIAQRELMVSGIDMVAIDEAHHVPAKSWQSFLCPFPDAPTIRRQLLFTATPFRTDRQPLRGGLCYLFPYRSAISHQLIKHPLIHLLKDMSHLETTQRWIKLLKRTKKIHDREHGQIIGYAQNISHAREIMQLCQIHTPSLRVDLWHSKMTLIEQQSVRDRFEQHPHQLDFIVQVKKCAEGYDHPHVNIVTFFKKVKSPLAFMQAVGRAVRRTATHRFAHIVGDQSLEHIWNHFKAHTDDATLDDFIEPTMLPNDDEQPFTPPSSPLIQHDEEDLSLSPLSPLPLLPPPFFPPPSSSSSSTIPHPFWWVEPFDITLLTNLTTIPFYSNQNDDGDDDSDQNELTEQDLEQLAQLPVQHHPFSLQPHQIITPSRHSPAGPLDLEQLTLKDISLIHPLPPHQKFAIAVASFQCQPPLVREVPLTKLLQLFNSFTEPMITSLIKQKNRDAKKNYQPFVSDRLYAHYYSSSLSTKRPLSPAPSPKRPCIRSYSIEDADKLIQSKEQALLHAKKTLEALKTAQQQFDHAFALLS